MYKVDIDTGGTMTDALVSGEGRVASLKVETTPHDVTIAFVSILEAATSELGFDSLRSFLEHVEVIRWSSTITSNVLAQRVGPKLGLLVTAGHETDLYDAAAASTVIGTLVEADDITGIETDASEQQVRLAVKSLLDRGIRRINISLAGAFPDGAAEARIVEMIGKDYPDHFLGSIPALAGTEVMLRPDDSTRTIASLMNAYVHPSLASTLYRAEEIVRDQHGWQGNVLIGHINGGMARIGKTRAFDTIESGPLFGTYASAAAAEEFGDGKVIAIDVGGTTAKASAVDNGRVVLKAEGDLFDIPLKFDFPLLRSIALGGGSVARVSDGRVTLGPDSMGAAPGPAAYGLGGRNATITDAFVVCGLLNPTEFLGGRRQLDAGRARKALDRHIGGPLELTTEQAGLAVVEAAWDTVAQLARETAEEVGWDPSACVVYAYGGNGPLFATAVADRLGARTARFFGYGAVYSALGSAISDVVHVYESALTGADHLASAGAALAAEAARDLRGEGFDPDDAVLEWELRSDTAATRGRGGDPRALLDGLDGKPTLVRLTARYPLPRIERPEMVGNGAGQTTSRTTIHGDTPCHSPTAVVGRELSGPLVVDGSSYTWLVPPGWRLATDARGDASLTPEGIS
ncbi:hydantoinase/oxoprolinase family protein [Modestobacter lapidis]|nr:hydantoinase/oxoprolinase family protein [Modestobacter lapidis]